MFDAAFGGFHTTSAFIIRKSSILSGGPVVVTAFRGLLFNGDGPDSPRGVDNYDPVATEGYIIGPSDAAFGRLILRRVSDPGGTPTISANIPITVNATSFPIKVDHLGNTGSINGRLDALDDRLFAAHIRNGRLWTAHNIAVTSTGAASGFDTERRNAARWYEVASHMYTLPLGWSLAGYYVNLSWWNGLDPAVRTFMTAVLKDVDTAQWTVGADVTQDPFSHRWRDHWPSRHGRTRHIECAYPLHRQLHGL